LHRRAFCLRLSKATLAALVEAGGRAVYPIDAMDVSRALDFISALGPGRTFYFAPDARTGAERR
jgi:hypothetical protein